MFSWIALLWNNPVVRKATLIAAVVGGAIMTFLWYIADVRRGERKRIEALNEANALKQRLNIEESQNDQVKEADDIRRDATPTDSVPEWMADLGRD